MRNSNLGFLVSLNYKMEKQKNTTKHDWVNFNCVKTGKDYFCFVVLELININMYSMSADRF